MKTLIIGEVLTRFANQTNEPFGENKYIKMNFGGAEFNVACHLGFWGEKVSLFSKIKPDWFIEKAINHLNSNKVNTNLIIENENENRNGFYILENGRSNKTPRVVYDRKKSAYCNLTELSKLKKAIELHDQIFVAGISLAVSETTRNTILESLKFAKLKNKTIIFDFNYRASLWDYELAKSTYEKVLPLIDVALCGWKDIDYILKIYKFNETLDYKIELTNSYKNLILKYPNIKMIASTKRNITGTFSQEITGYLFDTNRIFETNKYVIDNVVDRIGSGDAFASGLIYTLNNKFNLKDAIEFSTKSNVLKHSYYGDNEKMSLDLINQVASGIKDVNR